MHLTFESSRNWLSGREEPTCELGAANKCHKVKRAKCGEQKIMKPRVLQEVKGNEHEKLQMKAYQLPLLISNATTGH
jgi:hypothetical protein